ncbi:MAG: 2-oxoacid:acceptor oxidoreductase family protein [Caldilinea sp.]|jgi:2-oxoglutarate ferredoxin oxidoreductase subunit gamma|nr:2-oxoacid:acceptor oxidoreductase family protein [Caldilinea sp.]
METSIVVSGFGGQGALLAGQLLAHAALASGLEVTWIPSYGPEMRGGTAHCTVVVGDEPIGAPLVRHPECVVALNLPSVDKYEPLVVAGGLLVYDSTLVQRPVERVDLCAVAVPASEVAQRFGSPRLANLVLLGALLALRPVVTLEAMGAALRDHLPERHADLLQNNLEALYAGAALVKG